MQFTSFNAVCDVEIGDEVRITGGTSTTITDIRTIHYLKAHTIEFEFEMAFVPGLWFRREGFIYPEPVEPPDQGPFGTTPEWVLPKTTPEM